jgi:hypothetical protein
MQKRFYPYALLAIFVFALALRLYLAYQTDNFSLEESYFNYRQVESIRQDFLPAYVDDLSFSGRTHIFPPVYYYFLAFFSYITGTVFALKVIPNILACSLIIIMYLVVMELTKNRKIAVFAALASAFVPIFYAKTVDSASIYSFTIPLIFYLLYCFMRINDKIYLYQFLSLSFLLSLTSSISFLFVCALLLYLLLVKLEFAQVNKRELESILFVTFLTLWVNVLVYKRAFLMHSYALIWQNIPSQILDTYFRQVDIIASMTSIGLLPLLFGVYAVYRHMFKERDKRTYMFMAFALAVAFLLWFRLMTLDTGLMFLGVILIPLMGQALHLLFSYIERTKVESYAWVLWAVLCLLVVMTSVIPSIVRASVVVNDSVSQDEIDSLVWLKENSPKDSVILSTISEGDLVSAMSQRKNIADEDFVLIRSSDIIFDDVRQMYTAMFKTDAVELMSKYSVDYVYFSPRAKSEFNLTELKYVEKDCFELVYDKEVRIYRLLCEVKSA